jgi:hypothetical protein
MSLEALSLRTMETAMTNQTGLDGCHRDENAEISKKHGNTFVSTLLQIYGAEFAAGRSGDENLSDAQHDLDEPSSPI